jgi:hypothetical protein
MKKILTFTCCTLFATITFGQQNANEVMSKQQQSKSHSGYFTHKQANLSINVNYSFAPLEPKDEVTFMLHTATPRPLSLKIVDAKGKVVATWQPEQDKYLHNGTLDISHLKPGKYRYQILWDGQLAHSVQFNKK